MEIIIAPVAFVKNSRKLPEDDNWSSVISEIELEPHIPTEALRNISDFSHLEILFHFDRVVTDAIVYSGYPRGNTAFPLSGIFAQRKKDRPNRIGLCTVELIGHKERILVVKNLDAINGTPVIDIKPVFREFQPASAIKQPEWVAELMKNYWETKKI
jgi:tRNA (adenine37-N6)-methyltransferase